MEELEKRFKKKKVLVVGLGLQGGGLGLVNFFAKLGAKVCLTDLKTKKELQESIDKIEDKNVKLVLGRHRLKDFLNADCIFKGPSVPWDLPFLKKAQQKGITVKMELSFFASYCPGKIIGVTGTRGKTTTTMMIYQLLQRAGFSVYLGGNISGLSTISLLSQIKKQDWVVLELPSWPLSDFHRKRLSPHIGVFINFYPDHLNFYQTVDDYLYDKKAIYLYQKKDDILVANKALQLMIEKDAISSRVVYFDKKSFPGKLQLKGSHNLENASAAFSLSQLLGIDQNLARHFLSTFKGLPFRLEKVAKIKGVEIINDTTSTTPIACQAALNTVKGKRIILLLGGNSKNLPFKDLTKMINNKVDKLVLLKGSFSQEILPLLDKGKLIRLAPFSDLEKAFSAALKEAKVSDVILFSPAATSFSMFKNEFHRGEEFNRIVKKYEKEKENSRVNR